MEGGTKTWGLLRRIYLVVGIVCVLVAIGFFLAPGSLSPWLIVLVAALVLGVSVLASDELLHRIHRIYWWREWPK
jgi:hypothetical protein